MDYKEMYLKMMRASDEAIRILIQAQQECEEMYVSSPEPELIVLRQENDSSEWICPAQNLRRCKQRKEPEKNSGSFSLSFSFK